MKTIIEKTKNAKIKPDVKTVSFGNTFTDHMMIVDYKEGKGWFNSRIVPYAPIEIDPAATVFHYATEVFEGMKAYKTPTGEIQLFRHEENIKRMNNSAKRMALPEMDEDLMLQFIKEFVKVEEDWVPEDFGTSLYLRPFLFANDPSLSLHPTKQATFMIIASPVGNYFPNGLKPVPVMVEMNDVRAVRGGTGFAKCGGNYAGAMRASENAESLGFSQVLWIDGVERKYVEEAGGMNVMFKINGEIVTPELNGSVLPGITRKSAIEIFKSKGYKVSERLISLDELLEDAKTGALEEALMCGTAAVVCPIGEIAYGDTKFAINNGEIGKATQLLYDTLTGIQWGKIKDVFGFTEKL